MHRCLPLQRTEHRAIFRVNYDLLHFFFYFVKHLDTFLLNHNAQSCMPARQQCSDSQSCCCSAEPVPTCICSSSAGIPHTRIDELAGCHDMCLQLLLITQSLQDNQHCMRLIRSRLTAASFLPDHYIMPCQLSCGRLLLFRLCLKRRWCV